MKKYIISIYNLFVDMREYNADYYCDMLHSIKLSYQSSFSDMFQAKKSLMIQLNTDMNILHFISKNKKYLNTNQKRYLNKLLNEYQYYFIELEHIKKFNKLFIKDHK